ncbi:uroporphyrinogen-III synthase [Pseudoroseomonas globiformis]|uniref:Uroporphyrinogen-III synthase n=1 Tax=Teichococcus globiformis TaxID=2307229 RepID=A0ABV7G694_9PROT
MLITRPEPGCSETAAAVAALGWRPVLAPALLLRSCFSQPVSGVQAMILPSRAAARALAGQAAPDMKVLAVGPGTAAEARRSGFSDVTEAAGDASSLAVLAALRLDPGAGPLLLAVGRGYSAELATALRTHGFRVRRRVVYEAVAAGGIPESAQEALRRGEVVAALFLSPRSASLAQRQLRDAGLAENLRDIRALALSSRIVKVLAGMPWREIRATAKPDFAALLALLGPAPGPDSEGQE